MYLRKAIELQEPVQHLAPLRHTVPLRHLRAGTVALLLFFMLLITGGRALGSWEARFLRGLAPTGEDEVVKGLHLTRLAVEQNDMLLLLGSSELTFQDEFHAAKVFATKPTGFGVYVIGSGYRQSIHNFLVVSALGSELKGKQLVLFISPSWFTRSIAEKAYRKNFSLLQAYELAFTSPLSGDLKQRAASRLLALGEPGTDNAVLRGALEALATNDAWGRARYYALWPVGRISVEYLRLKDELDVLQRIRAMHLMPVARPATPRQLDWDRLMAQAEQEAGAKSANNPFGIHQDFYTKYVAPRLDQIRGSAAGETWLRSTEYDDLQLVLDALRELQAKPLFISLPVAGGYYDFKGHPVADRQAYYGRIKRMIEAGGFPVVDYGPAEYEPGMMRDPWHPGWKGSVQIAHTLDQFYHHNLQEARR